MLRQYRIRLAGDVEKREVEKQIFRRCAGDITLSPFDNVKLALDKREKRGNGGGAGAGVGVGKGKEMDVGCGGASG